MSLVDVEVLVATDDGWQSLRSGATEPPAMQLGTVVFTADEIEAWEPTGTQYTRLLGSWGGNNSRVITSHGSEITTTDAREQLRSDSIYAMCQAALWAANGSSTRRDKVIEVLDSVKDVTSWTGQSGQINLRAGWVASNLCRAAYIIDYDPGDIETFLRNLCRTIGEVGTGQAVLDWTRGGNWVKLFGDSRVQIGSLLEDEALILEGVDYAQFRASQTIYHSAHDGASIKPMRSGTWPATKNGSPHASATSDHWWTAVTASPWLAEYDSIPFADGTDAEVIRDLGHSCMSLHAGINVLRTLRACQVPIPQHLWDRVEAFAGWLAERVLHYFVNDSLLAPAGTLGTPIPGVGDPITSSWVWGAARALFGDETPADVLTLLERSEVQTAPPTGWDHQSAPLFTNGVD